MFHERALPDLGRNIKCGNSLIGPDFYRNQQMSLLTDDERATKGELLGAAQDAVMDSPIAANETFVDAEIVFALRKG